jgi:hypothetical protein
VTGTEEYVPEDCVAANPPAEGCNIGLFGDGTWIEDVNWSIADRGFPPEFCHIVINGSPGTCDTTLIPPDEPCLVRLIYNAVTGERTWEAIGWSGAVPFPGDCDCVEIAETCFIPVGTDCPTPTECPVRVNCDYTWEPVGWVFDSAAPFPDPDCTYTVVDQDTSPITETVEIPADEFVPDCGPTPIPPPAPFLVTSDCYCDPWVSVRQCCTLTNPYDWNDATTYIEVYTGSEEMRHLKIEAYQNPFGTTIACPCEFDDPFWECREPCATILVPQLPKSSKLIIDSRIRSAQLILSSGRSVNAARYIFSDDGNPFGWFDIGQCGTFCIVVSVDSLFVADDAWVSIGSVNRYLASGW